MGHLSMHLPLAQPPHSDGAPTDTYPHLGTQKNHLRSPALQFWGLEGSQEVQLKVRATALFPELQVDLARFPS